MHRPNCQKKFRLCKKFYVASLVHLSCIWEKNYTTMIRAEEKFRSSCQNIPTWSCWARCGSPEPISSPGVEPCLLFSCNLSEMSKEQNTSKGNCSDFPLLLASFLEGLAILWPSHDNVLWFLWPECRHFCTLRLCDCKSNLLILQTKTNAGTGGMNPGMCFWKKL